jgi:hypothetical protein
VIDAFGVVDVDPQELRAAELDGQDLDLGQVRLDRLGDIPMELAFPFVDLRRLSFLVKNGRCAPTSLQPGKCGC